MFIAYPPNEPKENYGKLLAIPSEDMTGKYARYLLASADGSGYLWRVNGSGSVNNDSSFEFGVRPVGAGPVSARGIRTCGKQNVKFPYTTSVESIKKEEVEKIIDRQIINGLLVKDWGSILHNNTWYWLASAYNGSYLLWHVRGNYGTINTYYNTTYGVRPRSCKHIKIKFAKDKNIKGGHRARPYRRKLKSCA